MSDPTSVEKEPSSTMIYISNLPFTTTDEQLRDLFTGYEIKTAYIAKRRNGRSKGFGFVNLVNESEQKAAIEKVDGKELESRKLTAKIAFNDERRNEQGELKEQFKKQLLPRVGENPSETVVYVSNLPWSFKDEELKKIFTDLDVKVATVATRRNGRSKGFGFVEFNTKEDQQKALTKDQTKIEERVIAVKPSVSYRGPNSTDKPTQQRNPRRKNQRGGSKTRKPMGRRNNDQAPRKYFIQKPGTSGKTDNTLYVSNLPFDLDEGDLRQIFQEFNVKSAQVAMRPNGKSKGFGFIEFHNSHDQHEAMKALDQSEVNNRVITVKLSTGGRTDNRQNNNNNNRFQRNPRGRTSRGPSNTRRSRPPRSTEPREPSSTMVYVSNLPFTVDDNQLNQVFTGLKVSKGYVATRRNGKSKGFGFVDFASSEEQQKALKLNGTELSGRPLVVQVAKKIQEKTTPTEQK